MKWVYAFLAAVWAGRLVGMLISKYELSWFSQVVACFVVAIAFARWAVDEHERRRR